ncbi:MAG: alpha-ribazole phosphatase [Methylococcaceae bacterium]|jgi:alpha-ribazole phosphatase
MDIYLIRHTQTTAPAGLCYGQTDLGLAESFADDARLVQQKLPVLRADCRVFSSPLQRCLELAYLLSDTVTTDPRLLEINFGDWEGQRFDDINTTSLQHWSEHFVEQAPPNGECFTDLYLRIGSFWQELLQHPAEEVLVITHAGCIRALLAQILALPLANAFHFKVDLGSVHKLQQVSDYTYINYLNL